MPGEHWDVNPASVNEFVPQSNGVALLEGIDTSGGAKFEFFDWYVHYSWIWFLLATINPLLTVQNQRQASRVGLERRILCGNCEVHHQSFVRTGLY
mmetsp:Transcript_30076/g.71575  ORF Transcript_30076/g.71575 Transcript_30076/m.71575 type:complete len:96 (-) Transcript_30076:3-290(-)